MKKIYLFCSAGMSSSILAEKMNKVAKEQSLDLHVTYFTENSIDAEGSDADLILLSPQIRYRQSDVARKFPEKTVYVINMTDYGLLKAENIVNECIKLLSN